MRSYVLIEATIGKARDVAVKAQISSLSTALEVYRGEGALGGEYPPSQTDNNINNGNDHRMLANPLSIPAVLPDTVVAGAHLLVHAMLGADLLGPPGFFDFSREDDNRIWADNTHADEKTGAYGLDPTTGNAMRPRYGYGASGFVSEEMRAKVSTLKEMEQRGDIDSDDIDTDPTKDQYLFVDAYGRPILYYRANSAATLMTGGKGKGKGKDDPGVFTQEDNGIITGSKGPDGIYKNDGVDFGAGRMEGVDGRPLHGLTRTKYPRALPKNDDLDEDKFLNTFERFIWDSTINVRNTPVNKDTFLLISAGKDARYGTPDDITNWARENR